MAYKVFCRQCKKEVYPGQMSNVLFIDYTRWDYDKNKAKHSALREEFLMCRNCKKELVRKLYLKERENLLNESNH